MKKENIYIDLSKCSEDERNHIFSLLPKEDHKVDMQIVKNYKHLHLCKIGWFVDIKPWLKTELTYSDFIKLFEGREVTWNIFKPHTGSTETETMGRETIKSDNTETLANALKQIEKMEADKAELLNHLQDEINEFSVLGYEPSQYQLGYNSAINDIMEILKPTPKI